MEVEIALWRLGLEKERVYQGEGFSGSFSGLTSALVISDRNCSCWQLLLAWGFLGKHLPDRQIVRFSEINKSLTEIIKDF